MRFTSAVVLALAISYAECKKIALPIDKNANLAFINMEGGGGYKPGKPAAAPVVPAPTPAVPKPAVAPPKSVVTPPPVAPTPGKAVATPAPTPKPVQPSPAAIQPKPVNPTPAPKPISTPGPGSVKQLVNFYDSQGKASPVRPYSYSQAVKQG